MINKIAGGNAFVYCLYKKTLCMMTSRCQSLHVLLRRVHKPKKGCSSDIDGITPEHVKWVRPSKIVSYTHLYGMLTVCIQFSIVLIYTN